MGVRVRVWEEDDAQLEGPISVGLERLEQSSPSDHTLGSDQVVILQRTALFVWECYKSMGFMETFCERGPAWRNRAASARLIRHDAPKDTPSFTQQVGYRGIQNITDPVFADSPLPRISMLPGGLPTCKRHCSPLNVGKGASVVVNTALLRPRKQGGSRIGGWA